MSQLQPRIAQFRKMASDDPDNELGHFRLGSLLMEDGQLEDAVQCFRRTLELSPQFSKVFQLLGSCLMKLGRKDEAATVLRDGFAVADERGDKMPRDEMARLLRELGEAVPSAAAPTAQGRGAGDGFRCQRPKCNAGSNARPLTAPPMKDELGQRIQQAVCAECWNEWLRDYSIKVINEMRLDLSTEEHQLKYDQIMKDFMGLE